MTTRHESAQREEAIIQLRRAGKSNQDIAEELGLTYAQIANMVHTLVQEGRVCRQKRGPRPIPESDRQRREDTVIRMNQDGASAKEIARTLGITPNTVYAIERRLIEKGRISRRPRPVPWLDVQDECVKTVTLMRKQRKSLRAIGRIFGVSKEWIRHVINKLTEKYGPVLFEPNDGLYTVREAADALKVPLRRIRELCYRGRLSCRRISREKGRFLFSESEVEAMRADPAVTLQGICPICGRQFFCYRFQKTCSGICRKEAKRRQREAFAACQPTTEALRGWYKDVWQQLQEHCIDGREEWIGLTEAKRRTGLSHTQLFWLKHRNIVTTRPHPERMRRGKPVTLYAASEMEIVRQVFAAHQAGEP